MKINAQINKYIKKMDSTITNPEDYYKLLATSDDKEPYRICRWELPFQQPVLDTLPDIDDTEVSVSIAAQRRRLLKKNPMLIFQDIRLFDKVFPELDIIGRIESARL